MDPYFHVVAAKFQPYHQNVAAEIWDSSHTGNIFFFSSLSLSKFGEPVQIAASVFCSSDFHRNKQTSDWLANQHSWMRLGKLMSPLPPSSPLPLLYQSHQKLHSVVGQVCFWAPHWQVVNHFLQQISHNPLSALCVCTKRCAQGDADLRSARNATAWNMLTVTAHLKLHSSGVRSYICVAVWRLWEIYLLVELLIHQQVCLGPPSEEPHDVFSHLWAEQLSQARSGRPGLHLGCPQNCRQQPVTKQHQRMSDGAKWEIT